MSVCMMLTCSWEVEPTRLGDQATAVKRRHSAQDEARQTSAVYNCRRLDGTCHTSYNQYCHLNSHALHNNHNAHQHKSDNSEDAAAVSTSCSQRSTETHLRWTPQRLQSNGLRQRQVSGWEWHGGVHLWWKWNLQWPNLCLWWEW